MRKLIAILIVTFTVTMFAKIPRFELFTNESVYDTQTELVWTFDQRGEFEASKTEAYCEDLVIGKYDDWRLPKIEELADIYDYDNMKPAFPYSIHPEPYCSSDLVENVPGDNRFMLYFLNGFVFHVTSGSCRVLCVRWIRNY